MIRNRRVKVLIGVLAVGLLASACGPKVAAGPPKVAAGPPACAAPAAPPDAITTAVFYAVNADRAAALLPALSWNPQLYCLATDWSAQMAASGNLRHRDLAGTIRSPGYSGYRTLGENVLRGSASMSGDAMELAWMNSTTHRSNILSSSFTSIGIGWRTSPDGSQVYATQNFGG